MDDPTSSPVSPSEPAAGPRPSSGPSPAPHEISGAPAIFDRAAAMEHVGHDPELLRTIVELFMDQGPARVTDITAAVRTGDAEGLESSAHSLKGSAATLGLERVRALSLRLEELGRSGPPAGAERRLEELGAAMDDALAALRGELARAT